MPTETTLVLLKPDAVRRRLVAELIGRFERRGFRIRGLKQLVLERSVAEEHYAEHSERPFFGELVDFITSGPIMALVFPFVGALVYTILRPPEYLDDVRERELALFFPDGLLP